LAISRERKEELVAEYKGILSENSALIFASPSGLTVKELEELRRQIRETGGNFSVVKNTLALIAFEETGTPVPEGGFDGACALGATSADVLALAKAMVDLSRASELFAIKGGVIDGNVIAPEQIINLADLPPLPVLRAQFLGLLQAPAARLAGVINGSIQQVVTVLHAYSQSEVEA
jgi:large subunit ribosomal protein L10